MDFWNVTAKDLRHGDEIAMPLPEGEEYVTVRDVDTGGASGRVAVRFEWTFWDDFDPNAKLTVRR